MDIQGLQKLTLLDYPGHVACTVFLGGCNLRCPFCHNSELLDGTAEKVMDDEALLAFLQKRTGLLDGVCFTGGEPLLRRDLPQLMEKIRALGYKIKLDTNGTRPAALRSVLEAGLADYVAMDIKNSPDRYPRTCGVETVELGDVYRCIDLLRGGSGEYEFRTTVVAELHDTDSFLGIGPMIAGAKRYFLQPFVDRDSVAWSGLHAPDKAALERYAEIMRPWVTNTEIRGI